MREVSCDKITDVIERLCIEANYDLPEDVRSAIERASAAEDGPVAQGILADIRENFRIAAEERVPICQATRSGAETPGTIPRLCSRPRSSRASRFA